MTSMNRDGLRALYEYNAYANHLVLDGLAQLSEDEFTRAPSPSHGSIQSLMRHALEGEAWFLAMCQGRTMPEPNLSTLDDLRHFQSEIEQAQQAFVASLAESDLSREVMIRLRDRPYYFSVWQLLTQAFVHSTHHRAELGILLGQMGHTLPTLDILLYFMQASGQAWV